MTDELLNVSEALMVIFLLEENILLWNKKKRQISGA